MHYTYIIMFDYQILVIIKWIKYNILFTIYLYRNIINVLFFFLLLWELPLDEEDMSDGSK